MTFFRKVWSHTLKSPQGTTTLRCFSFLAFLYFVCEYCDASVGSMPGVDFDSNPSYPLSNWDTRKGGNTADEVQVGGGGSTVDTYSIDPEDRNIFRQGKPLKILSPCEGHKCVKIVEENLQILQDISGPISVLSVVGSIHTGKSYFLNQMMGQSSGFPVGYGVEPETAGLWLWSKPLNVNGTKILFMDSEGFHGPNATDTYDAKVYAIATLLSSELLYNTVKFIDRHSIDYLQLLTARANIFGLRAYAQRDLTLGNTGHSPLPADVSVGEMIEHLLPSGLSLIVQDFIQDLGGTSALSWLLSLIDNAPGHTGDGGNRSILKSYFKSIDCLTLTPPTNKIEHLQKLDEVSLENLSKQYLEHISNFRARLFARLVRNPKSLPVRSNTGQANKLIPMSGASFIAVIRFLVHAANEKGEHEGSNLTYIFPEAPSILEKFTRLQLDLMKSDLVAIFERDTLSALGLTDILTSEIGQRGLGESTLYRVSEDEVENVLLKSYQRVIGIWRMNVEGIENVDDDVKVMEQTLRRLLIDKEAALRGAACERIKSTCRSLLIRVNSKLDQTIAEKESSLPHIPHSLTTDVAVLLESYQSELSQIIDETVGTKIRVGSCCIPAIEDGISRAKSALGELLKANEIAVEETLLTALKNSNAHLCRVLGLPSDIVKNGSAGGNTFDYSKEPIYLVKEEVFRLTVDNLLEEGKYNFIRSCGRLIDTPRAAQLLKVFETFLRDLQTRAFHQWEEICKHATDGVLRNAPMRMAIGISQKIIFPTAEDIFTSPLVKENFNSAVHELKGLHCHGAAVWLESYNKLLTLLEEQIVKLDRQNVQAIKDLSQGPLIVALRRLEASSAGHYFWFKFRKLAEQEAKVALKVASAQQQTPLSAALEQKVVDMFMKEDLQSIFRVVSFNLFRVSSITVAILVGFWSIYFRLRSKQYGKALIAVAFLLVFLWDNVLRNLLYKLLYGPFLIAYSACNASEIGEENFIWAFFGVHLKWVTTLLCLHTILLGIEFSFLGLSCFPLTNMLTYQTKAARPISPRRNIQRNIGWPNRYAPNRY